MLGDMQQCPGTVLRMGLAPGDVPHSGAWTCWHLVHITISSAIAHSSPTSKNRNVPAGMAADRKNEKAN